MPTSTPVKTNFERILVPIDFTDISNVALQYAKSVAKADGSEIVLTHANDPVNPITPSEVVWFDEITALQPSEQQLQNQAAELNSQGFRTKAISLTGVIQDEVLATAQREDSDLIVLGTHARTGLPRLFLGSDAEALYRLAHCPILVVGPHAPTLSREPDLSHKSVDPWHPRNILYSCNLGRESAQHAAFAFHLAQRHGARLTIVHVDDTEGKVTRAALMPAFEEAFAEATQSSEKPEYLWRVLLSGYALGSTIADIANEHQADLVVLGAREASFTKTHFARGIVPLVTAKARCPVMVLHR